MENRDSLSTQGYIKKANDFFKYLAIDYKIYKEQTRKFFARQPIAEERKEKNTALLTSASRFDFSKKIKKTSPTLTIQKDRLSEKENIILIKKSKKFQNMSNLRNSVQLIGRLGKNPEVKQLESGRFVANVSIATNDIYKNSKGEKVIETQWHNLVAWGKNAENFQKILAKGDEVAIQGKLTHRSYEKDGITRYVTEVVVNEFVKLSRGNPNGYPESANKPAQASPQKAATN